MYSINFNLSTLFLSFLTQIARKVYGGCDYYTYQVTALLLGIFLFWFGVAYKLRLESYILQTVTTDTSHSCSDTSGASATYSGCGTYSQATPGLLNLCVTGCSEFSNNQLGVSRILTIVFSIYLVLTTNLVQWKIPLCL